MKLYAQLALFSTIVLSFMVDGLNKLHLMKEAYAGQIQGPPGKYLKDFEVNMYSVGVLFFILLFAFFINQTRKKDTQD